MEGLAQLVEASGVRGKGILQDESLANRLVVVLKSGPGRVRRSRRHTARFALDEKSVIGEASGIAHTRQTASNS